MSILQSHVKTIVAGFILLAIILGAGIATGGTVPGIYDFARFGHVLAGIVWIGLLYYFNFVQVPSLGGVTAETKADIFKEGSIVRRALFWFRMGAHTTLVFGLILYYALVTNGLDHAGSKDIMIGATFGIIMWFKIGRAHV